MIGELNTDVLDPRMTMDLGILRNKQDSLAQNSGDISGLLPSENGDSSFNIPSIQKGRSSKNKKMVMMSMALPKKGKFSLPKTSTIRNSGGTSGKQSWTPAPQFLGSDLQSPMRIVDEETEQREVFDDSFELSTQNIVKPPNLGE
jgi:hypothetical protein